MSNFDLIKEIRNPKKPPASLLPEGISYQTITVPTYDAGSIQVHVPESSAADFVVALDEYTVVTKPDIRQLAREFRGIIGS